MHQKKGNFLKFWLIMAVLMAVSACSPATVPEGYDEARVIQQAETIVTKLTEGEYEAVVASFQESLQGQLTAEGLETAILPEIDRVGPLLEIKDRETASTTVNGVDYALVVIIARHEHAQATYTITMDQEGKLLGLYMR